MSQESNVSITKCLKKQMSQYPNVSRAKCLKKLMSQEPNVSRTKSLKIQMSQETNVSRIKCLKNQIIPNVSCINCFQTKLSHFSIGKYFQVSSKFKYLKASLLTLQL